MSNFKSGSGNLDFGEGDSDDGKEAAEEAHEVQEKQERSESMSTSSETSASDSDTSEHSAGEEAKSGTSMGEYPYFVRRSNVGDERDIRLELHVRDEIASQEAAFRSELAEQLGVSEVSKTDAREFALLTAFQHPERVAELMREEGFDILD